ncbi:MAG: hypothetical protein AABY67_04690 [Nitrospirota bacterium]
MLILSASNVAHTEELKLDSQGKIDLKESMKGKGEVVVPLDQLDKLDPEQLKGKKKEIVYGKKPPRPQSPKQSVLEKGGTKIENYTAPVEENLQGIKVTPDQTETSPSREENSPKIAR